MPNLKWGGGMNFQDEFWIGGCCLSFDWLSLEKLVAQGLSSNQASLKYDY